jgi:hypothetical protein
VSGTPPDVSDVSDDDRSVISTTKVPPSAPIETSEDRVPVRIVSSVFGSVFLLSALPACVPVETSPVAVLSSFS